MNRKWQLALSLVLVLGAGRAESQVGGATSAPATSSKNLSGTITSGGTLQNLGCCSSTTKSVEFENICTKSGNCNATTDNCYLVWGTGGGAQTLLVPAGGYYLRSAGTVPSDVFQVTCDTTGDKFWAEAQ